MDGYCSWTEALACRCEDGLFVVCGGRGSTCLGSEGGKGGEDWKVIKKGGLKERKGVDAGAQKQQRR